MGRPANVTSSRPRPRTSSTFSGAVSAFGLASPLVVIVPSSFRAMTRWVFVLPGRSASLKTATRPSRTVGSVSGAASTMSPTSMRGCIEPLSTTNGRQPMTIGSSVTSRQPATNHSHVRATSAARNRPVEERWSGSVPGVDAVASPSGCGAAAVAAMSVLLRRFPVRGSVVQIVRGVPSSTAPPGPHRTAPSRTGAGRCALRPPRRAHRRRVTSRSRHPPDDAPRVTSTTTGSPT